MKRTYIQPHTTAEFTALSTSITTLSEGEQTEGRVHDPEEEVDAEEALANYRDAWVDENGLW